MIAIWVSVAMPVMADVASDREVARFLERYKGDANALNEGGMTPLCEAIFFHPKLEIIQGLIKAGAKVNAKCQKGYTPGWTPLMFAVGASNQEVTKELIKAGADVNARNDFGYTALKYARTPEIKKILIDAGADANIETGKPAPDTVPAEKSKENDAESAKVTPSMPLSPAEQKEYEFIRKRFLDNEHLLNGVGYTLGHSADSKDDVKAMEKVMMLYVTFFDAKQIPKLVEAGGIKGFKKELAGLLTCKDPVMRGSAAIFLGLVDDPAYNADIAKLLADKPGPVPEEIVKKHVYNFDRALAAKALGLLGAREYAPRLAELLQSKDESDRIGAAIGLGGMKDKAYAPAIAKRLSDNNERMQVKMAAVSALAELDAVEYANVIAKLLKDKEEEVQVAACYALARLKAKALAGNLAALLPEKFCNGHAAKALALLGAKEYTKDIVRLLEDKDSSTRCSALVALGILNAKDQVPAVVAHLQDKEPSVRAYAAVALLLMGDRTHVIEMVEAVQQDLQLIGFAKMGMDISFYFKHRLDIYPVLAERQQQLTAAVVQEWEQINREVKVPQPGVPANKSQPKGNGSEAK
jgi:HEAT repeat protein